METLRIEEIVEILVKQGYYVETSRLPKTGEIVRLLVTKPRSSSISKRCPNCEGVLLANGICPNCDPPDLAGWQPSKRDVR